MVQSKKATYRASMSTSHASTASIAVVAESSHGVMIRWASHPSKCLDVSGGMPSNGVNIQLWDCSDGHPNMMFTVPAPDTPGVIRYASHPSKCLDVSRGEQSNGVNIQLWDCGDGQNPNMMFTVPAPGVAGQIHWASHDTKCLDVSGGDQSNGANIQLWECQTRHANMMFVYGEQGTEAAMKTDPPTEQPTEVPIEVNPTDAPTDAPTEAPTEAPLPTHTFPRGQLKVGHLVVTRGQACAIRKVHTTKYGFCRKRKLLLFTGKKQRIRCHHGPDIVDVIGFNIFTLSSCHGRGRATEGVEVPYVSRKTYLLVDVDYDGNSFWATLQDDNGNEKHLKVDLTLTNPRPQIVKDIRKCALSSNDIVAACEVTVLKWGVAEMIVGLGCRLGMKMTDEGCS
jgi:hypothetical protein